MIRRVDTTRMRSPQEHLTQTADDSSEFSWEFSRNPKVVENSIPPNWIKITFRPTKTRTHGQKSFLVVFIFDHFHSQYYSLALRMFAELSVPLSMTRSVSHVSASRLSIYIKWEDVLLHSFDTHTKRVFQLLVAEPTSDKCFCFFRKNILLRWGEAILWWISHMYINWKIQSPDEAEK